MKLKISRQELADRLANIQNIVEKRNTMPILSHFLLDVKKKGSTITATDIETAIREPIDAAADHEGKLCIPARKLYEIVKEVDADIVLQSDDAQWLRVTAGRSNFRLACLAPEEFPAWPAMDKSVEFELDAPVLLNVIEKTLYSAGESDTRYTLNGLLFHIEGTRLTVVGTDGHRMAVVERTLGAAVSAEEKKVIVPRKTAAELRKVLGKDGKAAITVGTNHILFKVGDVEFLARMIDGTYPNYTQVIPAESELHIIVSREAMVRALRRVSVMSKERSNAVKVEIESGVMRLTSSNPDLGDATDEVLVDYTGEALSIGYNARYLLDVLQAMSSDRVTIALKDQLSPSLITEEADPNYRCVVMPMRI